MQRLIQYFGLSTCLPQLQQIKLAQMRLDSRTVKEGDLFIGLRGHQQDGRQFIPQAIKAGAKAILTESETENDDLQLDWQQAVPILSVYQLGKKLSAIAGYFYAQPSSQLCLVGVTGTNGKSTIVNLLAQWVTLLGKQAAVMGTIGNGLYGQVEATENTTGSAVEIQANLAQFVEQQAEFVAMEVSSHGLVQGRVEALSFDLAIFTNLSRDHLDYHQDMTSYALAKKRLFSELNTKAQVINIDDPIGKQWLSDFPSAVAVSQFPLDPDIMTKDRLWVVADKIVYTDQGAIISLQSSWGKAELTSHLIGEFNVQNLLLAFAALLKLGLPFEQLVATVAQLQGVCGRMEKFSFSKRPLVLVDYAHTPDALEKALLASRLHCQGKLWCVFGCGGDRDRGKRPLMAQIAEKYADWVVLTDDNPRTEDPRQIMQDLQQGISQMEKVVVEHQRQQALAYAINHADSNDVILVAGKGHEDYQIIGTVKHRFSDRETVMALLSSQA
ncbi:UDP-N-acetylmuramoyl-L-alanyl-D-glutamate--2,6-diaminopimelate ligase [Mergibacter septicus]|uniref:UDP-N-acetylmuramoyl-L-alanyl-D-glutamate--2, 6-diaminopimelate ligase n=1 Tax=Mergibacter septicus TaxID=221402 RepID=UPI001C752DE7|nr:UDP-N-acetylmuramoyl-L-alanyl-D-glutamate--2,6-diaminopimelate ligase [Mergibacter septicus]QDJ12426.1 UDP-N-acetylmuramoyl-L-alanyl-D-glutamate--2,6-diaminopimelate ligase [Mergibacter septicus]